MAARKEWDLRADRFESEMKMSDVKKLKYNEAGSLMSKVFKCKTCNTLYEERSRHCPRCDTRTMGKLVPIKESERENYKRQSIDKTRKGIYG